MSSFFFLVVSVSCLMLTRNMSLFEILKIWNKNYVFLYLLSYKRKYIVNMSSRRSRRFTRVTSEEERIPIGGYVKDPGEVLETH